MNHDYNILEEKFKQLPEDIQIALTSTEISKEIKNIADKNNLLLDQAAILFDLTSYVMLGLVPSKEFASTLSKEANIDMGKAIAVTQEINTQVFAKIRSSMQNLQSTRENVETETAIPNSSPIPEKMRPSSGITQQPTPRPVSTPWTQKPTQGPVQPDHSDLEKAGDFTIVSSGDNFSVPPPTQQRQTFTPAPKPYIPTNPSITPKPAYTPIQTPIVPKPIIQTPKMQPTPQSVPQPFVPKTPDATTTTPIKPETKTEPLADHLLNSFKPVIPNIPQNKPTQNVPPQNIPTGTPTPNVPPKPRGPDMYREMV